MSSNHQNRNAAGDKTRKEQTKTRREQSATRTKQDKIRTEQSATRTEQDKTRTEQSDTRTEQAKTQINQARTQTEQSASNWLAAIIESSDDAIISKTLDGIITSWNRGAQKIFGYSAEEAIGRPMLLVIPPERANEEPEILARIARGENVEHFETVRVRKDGKLIDVSATISPLKDGGGKIVGASKIARDITERKKTESALEESESRLRLVLQAAQIGHWEIDPVTRSARCSDLNFGIFGYAEPFPEWSVQKFFSHLHPDDRERVKGIVQNGLATQQDWQFESRIIRQDQAVRWISAQSRFFQNIGGHPLLVLGICEDITGRKLAEEARRESDSRYRSLFDCAPDGIVIVDPKGYYLDGNAGICRMLGYTRDEFIRLHASDVVAKTEIHRIDGALTEILAKSDYHQEWQFRRKDGSIIDVDTIATALPDGNLTAIIHDITERKQMELAVHESEERFRSMANSMSQLAWIAKADGFIFWYNQRWYEYTGTTPKQMEGWGWQSVHDPAVLPRVMEKWQAAIAAGEPFEMEFPLRGADGKFRRFLTRGQPLKDSTGKVMQWFGTNTDVEILKEAEEKVRQLNAGLEQRVKERTAELEAANKELEAFSFSVSHDLRAPLRAINGFAEIVLGDFGPQLPEAGRRNLERIRNGGLRMGELIDDLLAFSRLSRQSMKRQEVDSAKLVQIVLDESQPQRENRRFELNVGNLPVCLGDAALLKQVWVNLIYNAIKYTRGREPAVIEIGCLESDGGRVTGDGTDVSASPATCHPSPVTFFVRDNGAGFDMRYADKLFGVFQRLHRADEFEGTGVGLAIVQRIVHRHGGRIWADAAVGRGATFYFTLEGEDKS